MENWSAFNVWLQLLKILFAPNFLYPFVSKQLARQGLGESKIDEGLVLLHCILEYGSCKEKL